MSADNTILILELNDQYRVDHIQGMDNIYWKNGEEKEKPISLRIFEFFYGIKPINCDWLTLNSRDKALGQAIALYEDAGYVEYGIQTLKIDKTWRRIVLEAKLEVDDEISYVYNNPHYSGDTKVSILDKLRKTKNEINGWLATNTK